MPYPTIDSAPKDRLILVYGRWAWESTDDPRGELGWRVAQWCEYVGEYDEETYHRSGGFRSETMNPYKDYSLGTHWAELPAAPDA